MSRGERRGEMSVYIWWHNIGGETMSQDENQEIPEPDVDDYYEAIDTGAGCAEIWEALSEKRD